MRYAATMDDNQNVLSLHKTIDAARKAAKSNGAEFIRPAWRKEPPENDHDSNGEIIYVEYGMWSLAVNIGNSGAFISGEF